MKKFIFAIFILACGLLGSSQLWADDDASIKQNVRWQETRKAILAALDREISPWRKDHSKGGMNWDSRFGDPEKIVKPDFEMKACNITLAFPKGPIEWKESSKFLLDTIKQILNACHQQNFYPEEIKLALYSNGDKLEGTGEYDGKDGKIRALPPDGPRKKSGRSIRK